MAIRDIIDENITTHGANAITGAKMNTTLKAMCTDYEADVTNEATARHRADTSLQNQITAEVTARGAADTALNTAIAVKYTKPASGIPKTDLASGVQTSLGKADTALQSVPNTYRTAAAQAVIDATLLPKANVKQVTGQGTNDVMSQKATTDALAAKANTDGAYEGLVAGTALSLAGGAQVQTPFVHRATAGANVSVGNGAALIKALGGNSLVWNQALQNGNFAQGTNGWTRIVLSQFTVTDGVATIKKDASNITTASAGICYGPRTGGVLAVGHKYYLSVNVRYKYSLTNRIGIYLLKATGGYSWKDSYIKTDCVVGGIYRLRTIATTTDAFQAPGIGVGNYNDAAENEIDIWDFVAIDLTQMFGAGNEPTTTSEFEALFPNPYYTYDAGRIINFTATGLKAIGFNQYNPATGKVKALPMQYQITGTYTSITQNGATITPDANGLFTPSAGEFTITGGDATTCVHLVHSGSRNGEFESYQENTMPLDIANIKSNNVAIFPDGMKSAGTAKDYFIIDADGYARKAVVAMGTRAYQSGDENDATLVTDKTNTVYPLATPVTYTLDTPIFMGYAEKDWGTEELLVAQNTMSTPFYGTIEYPMNAPDEIKNLPKNYVGIAASGSSTIATLLEAFKTAGIISAYTITYSNGAYGFTITPPSE